MALSRTTVLLARSGALHGTGSYTTGSFTPPNSSLLVVSVAALENNGTTDPSGDLTISDSAGLTWTPRRNVGAVAGWSHGIRIWTAPVSTGASMTLTFDCGTRNIYNYVTSVVAYTGYDTSTPVGATGANAAPGNDGAQSLTLSGFPATGSEVFAVAAFDTSTGVTPGSGWTEIHDDANAGDGIGIETQVKAAGALAIGVVSSAAAGVADRSPSVTFTGYVPKTDDVVVLWPSSTTTATITIPSGWVNPLGGTTDVESDAHEICCVYHLVTAAEESGGTTTYTATNLYDATETGNVVGCIVRPVDPAAVLDSANSAFDSANAATPHVLAGLTGTNLSTGSLVLSAVAKDGTGTYTTPTGWTQIVTSNTNQGKWLGRLDALTTSGTDVSATNITPSAGDEYASITVALTVDPTPPNDDTVSWVDVGAGGAASDTVLAAIEIKEATTADATVTPDVIARSFTVPQSAVSVGGAPEVVARSFTSPAPAVSIAAAPATVARTLIFPAPAVDVAAAPTVLARSFAIPAVTASESTIVTPAAIARAFTIPNTAIDIGTAPSAIAATVILPQSAVDVGVAAAVLARVFVLPPVTADGGAAGDATVMPAAIARAFVTPQTAVSVTATPGLIASTAMLPAPLPMVGAAPPTIAGAFNMDPLAVSVAAGPSVLVLGLTFPAFLVLTDTLPDIPEMLILAAVASGSILAAVTSGSILAAVNSPLTLVALED